MSMEYALKAVKIFEDLDYKFGIREAKNCIAKIERENDNFQKGIEIYTMLLSDADALKYPIQKGKFHLNLANVYMSLKNEEFKKAQYHLQQAEKIFRKNLCDTRSAMVHIKYGRFYKTLFLRSKNKFYYQKAIEYTQKALKVFIDKNQQNNLGYAYYTLATINSIASKHKKSIQFYKKSLDNYEAIGNLTFEMRIKQHLFVAYSILGENEHARAINAEYVKIKDAIFGIEKRKLLADAQTKYETQKIEKEIAQKQAAISELESQKNKNLLAGAVIITALLILSSLFYFVSYRSKKQAELVSIELKETQKRLAIEKQYRDSELKALKSQMNPHFIFNALNSIQEYILLNKKNLASDYLGKFADLIRTYLHHSDTGAIYLQEEIDSLKIYLDLECLRFEETLSYTFKVMNQLNTETIYIPTMLLQPYVENAIKHGLLHKKENREIDISFAKLANNTIECVIIDNGIGRKKSKEIQAKRSRFHKSFADNATQERLDLLNFEKEEKIGVQMIDLQNKEKIGIGTKVIITIPIISKRI